jgi:predicted TIM-barrel fold metal-dependent hydrolase
VVGAIEVEASPWIEDNLWVLDVCAAEDIMVGVVGNLRPDDPAFGEYLERYHKNPLFRGIRCGNLWGYDIAAQSHNSGFLSGLRLLAQADLVLDTANPRMDLLEAIVRISDAVSDLRIVIDHLPAFEPPGTAAAEYDRLLKEFQARPNIYCKLSAVIHPVDGQISTRLAEHKPRLDQLVETFGEDRVLFGSDWPNNEFTTSIEQVFLIMREYYSSKSLETAEKYFWKNSCRAYKWAPRSARQPRCGV